MAEYIEREAAIDAIMKVYVRTAEYKTRERVFKAEEAVHQLPVADVASVVHGQWIIGVDDDDFDVKCSKCGWTDIFEVAGIAAVERIAKTMHYCLNCGARMDGGVNDEKLDAAPTVDAVEVVRCKDCEYSYDESSYLCCSHGVCADCEVPLNFYCAEGKRKEPDE